VKYHEDIGLAEELSSLLIAEFQQEMKWQIDVVTAIPLSPERYLERGYNQAYLFARPFAWAIQKPFLPKLVGRKCNTSSQVGLSKRERQKNIQNTFLGYPKTSGLKILVLDDVTTTGATLMECARALRDQGVQEVYGLTLAKTPTLSNQHNKINENLI
jgi:competence protein ComFC